MPRLMMQARTACSHTADDVLKDGVHVVTSPGLDGLFGTADDRGVFFIRQRAPDAGLSAPFNSWMTFFGQFFDHGLDLVTKGGSGTVFIPLQPDDPLYVPGSPTNFMVLTRATNQPGPDGILGTADDIHEHANTTSPFVDQNQTYSSHPSHQVFLRAYEFDADGEPVATGKLITNRNLGADGIFGTADDVEIGGMATWAVVKAQARDILGINLTDADVDNVPLLATDALRQLHQRAERLPAGRDAGASTASAARPTTSWSKAIRRRRSASSMPCGPATPSLTTSRTMPCRRTSDGSPARRRRRSTSATPSTLVLDARHSTTTSCSTRTTLPATAASTRTSA